MEEISMNKMGTKPIKTVMLTMGTPMILSMMLQAFYNIVDSYFVSAMKDSAGIVGAGEYGIHALTLAFPIQMLMVAVGVGTGVGINSLLSKSLGQSKKEKASRIAGNAIFLGICTYLLFLILGIFGTSIYLRSQTTDPIVLQMATKYLLICMVFSFGVILFMIYEKLLQSTGKTTLSTIAQVAGAIANIILDPIMIFGLLGCPELGIAGAAYATVIGQIVSLALGALFHHHYNTEVPTTLNHLKPDVALIKEIYQIGIPAIIMQALMSFMTYGINIIFSNVSDAAVTAYGMYYKIQQFVFFAAFGMNNALISITAFNYGLQNERRVLESIKYGILYSTVITVVGAIGLQLFANPLVSLFSLSLETASLCVTSIRIITIGYLFVGVNIAYQGIFQAFGYGIHSLIISLLRLIVIALPIAWICTLFTQTQNLIWWSFPLAEAIAFVVAFIFMKKIKMQIFAKDRARL